MSNYKNKIPGWVWAIIIVFVLIFLFALYVGSLGTADYVFNKGEKEDELKERKRIAKHRHEKLQKHIARHEIEKERISKWFRWVYFSVRLLLFSIWVGFNCILYFQYKIKDLGDILNWNEAILIGIFAFVFLFYRNLTNLNEMLSFVRNRVENWVYGKFISKEMLDEKIYSLMSEKIKAEEEISLIERKQNELNNNVE